MFRRLVWVLLCAAVVGCGDEDSGPTAPDESPEVPETPEVLGRWVGERLTVVLTADGRWTSDGVLIGEAECGGSTGELRLRMQLGGVVELGPPARISATVLPGRIVELRKSITATFDPGWKRLRGTASGRGYTPIGCNGSVTHEFVLTRVGK